MTEERSERIREHLLEIEQGNTRSVDEVMPLVYDELRALAAYHLQRERSDHTLQPTALVHEVYMRLANQDVDWQCRTHFIRIAAQQIRRVLVDHARAHNRQKRGGGRLRVTLTDGKAVAEQNFDLLALNEALERLDAKSSEDRTIVELKYFGGLTEKEIGDVLDMNERTVRRRWSFARAWLFRELGDTNA